MLSSPSDTRFPFYRHKLPNSQTVMVLGIISLVTLVACFCSMISWLFAIVGLLLGYMDYSAYKRNPQLYIAESYNNLMIGIVCSAVCLGLSVVGFAVLMVMGIIGRIEDGTLHF